MNIGNKKKKGSILALAIVIASILLVIGLAYSKLVSQTMVPTLTIDEHTRVQYLAEGVCRMVLLKYHKFPTDFYAAWLASSSEFLLNFGENAPEFQPEKFLNTDDQPTSLLAKNKTGHINDMVRINVASLTLQTNFDKKWKEDVVTVVTTAKYLSSRGEVMMATSTMSIVVNRDINESLTD